MDKNREIPSKLGIRPPYDPAIPLICIYPEETKTEKDTCIYKVHCSTIYNRQELEATRCPLTDEQIKNLWHMYTMEYYSAIKWNTFELVLMRWMNLETIIWSETNILY